MMEPTTGARGPWSLLDDLARVHNGMSRWFELDPLGGVRRYPAVNVWAAEHEVVVEAEVPGVEAGDIDISVLQNTLTLSGKRAATPVGEQDVLHRRERYTGEFTRTLEFPYRLDGEKVKATLKNGVLRVHVEKAEEDRPRKIEIQKG